MNYFYDALIFGFLILDGIFILLLLRVRRSGRRKFPIFPALVFFAALFSWLIIFYGSFLEPRFLVITKQNIQLKKNPSASLRVALISDLHLGPYKQEGWVKKVVAKTLEVKPDLVLLAGDFVYDHPDQVKFLAPLKDLKAPLGTYAALGNHDYGVDREWPHDETILKTAELVRSKLESLGVQVLRNEGKLLRQKPGGDPFFIFGTDEIWVDRASVRAALDSLGFTKSPKNALFFSHNPDIVKVAERLGIPLVLTGHTHGGQIRLPLIGSVSDIPTRLGRDYDRGLFKFKSTQLFITSGAGEMGPRARLLVPPEIAILEITY